MNKVAHCACGSLRVEVVGKPTFAAMRHCEPCQRRTGSAFSLNAYYKKTDAKCSGESSVFIRDAQEGRKVKNHCCPACGTTLNWELDIRPNDIGMAVGAFFDPKHPWIHLPRGRCTGTQPRR